MAMKSYNIEYQNNSILLFKMLTRIEQDKCRKEKKEIIQEYFHKIKLF